MPYEIHIDRPSRLLRISVTGLPDANMLGAYERDVKQHIAALTGDGGSFDMLFDLRKSQVIEQQNLPQLQARSRWYVDTGFADRRRSLPIPF